MTAAVVSGAGLARPQPAERGAGRARRHRHADPRDRPRVAPHTGGDPGRSLGDGGGIRARYLAMRRKTERLRAIVETSPKRWTCCASASKPDSDYRLDSITSPRTPTGCSRRSGAGYSTTSAWGLPCPALTSLAERCPTPAVRHFVAAVNQASELGLSMVRCCAHRLHARGEPTSQHLRAGAQIPIKVLFPLILCLLPALMIVVVGPAGLAIVDQLHATWVAQPLVSSVTT